MLKPLGVLAISLSALWMGSSLTARMRAAKQSTSFMLTALIYMQQQISFHRTPLPRLMAETAEQTQGVVRSFFLRAAEALERNRTETAEAVLLRCMQGCENLSLTEGGVRSCRRLFGSIGWMDGANQTEALQRAVSEFELLEKQITEEYRHRGRCGLVLGGCTGLAMLILLI